jgi:hypothetical protein
MAATYSEMKAGLPVADFGGALPSGSATAAFPNPSACNVMSGLQDGFTHARRRSDELKIAAEELAD